ncbi:nitric oxide reductase transcription regulator, partial [Vibrio fortis]
GATEDFQRTIITDVLEQANFNWAQAGRTLKTDRANLTRLAKRLGLNVAKSHSIERTK